MKRPLLSVSAKAGTYLHGLELPISRLVGFIALLVVAVFASCVDGNGPVQPGASGTATLAIRPVFSSAAQDQPAEINLIRVTILQLPENTVLATLEFEVDPNADEWPVTLDFPLPDDGANVLLEIVLIHLSDSGDQTIEFSGQVGPLSVEPGVQRDVQEVEVVRGPLDNLSVTSVTISPESPPTLFPGESTELSAQVVKSDPDATPVLFWTSLSGVASVDELGLVTAVAPGTARIVATAGSRADTVTVTVIERPTDADLMVTKVADRTATIEGDTITYTVVVTNLGVAGATTVQVRDSLGAGLSFVSAENTRGSYDGIGGVWILPTLAVGQVDTLRLRAVVLPGAAGTVVTNTAWSLAREGEPDPEPANDTAQVALDVDEVMADLALSKVIDDELPFEGDTVTYTLTVTNLGPYPATAAQVEDQVPAGLTLVEAQPSEGSYDVETGLWSVGELGLGASSTLLLRAVVDDGSVNQVITNVATSLGAVEIDPQPGNDAAAATLVVDQRLADLSIEKEVDQTEPFEGDTITFTVTVRNGGPQPARGVRVLDALPVGLTLVSSTATQGAYDPGTATWNVGDLEVDSSDTLRLRVSTDVGTGGQQLTNLARALLLTSELDPNPTNNADSASVIPQGTDLEVTKSVDDATPGEGGTVLYTVTVTNQGSITATGLEVTDLLPTGVTLALATPSAGSYTPGTGTWSVASLAAGASETLTLEATVDLGTAGQTITNTATLMGLDQVDRDASNDVASAPISPQGIDVEVTKAVDDPSPDEGDTVIYTVTVTNHGSTSATGLEVTDLLPTGVTLGLATPSTGSYTAGTGVWAVGSLAAGASETLTLEATVDESTAGQSITNTAQATALDQTDTNAANDVASAPLTVTKVDLSVTRPSMTPHRTSALT